MIKLSASLSKKCPLPDVNFSSQQYGASLEAEVSDQADGRDIANRLAEMYDLLEKSVDAQLEAASRPSEIGQPAHHSPPGGNGANGSGNRGGNGASGGNGGNGGGNGRKASQAQIKAVFAISKDRGMSRDELILVLQGEFSVAKPDDLDVRQASDLIGRLQKLERARR